MQVKDPQHSDHFFDQQDDEGHQKQARELSQKTGEDEDWLIDFYGQGYSEGWQDALNHFVNALALGNVLDDEAHDRLIRWAREKDWIVWKDVPVGDEPR